MKTKTALLVIATGEKYHYFADYLMNSAAKFLFEHTVILFTDNPAPLALDRCWDFLLSENKFIPIPIKAKGFPKETLMRYHTFVSEAGLLSQYKNLFYVDADMRFVAPVKEDDILSEGITATLHPGYVGLNGTPENNPESAAYCPVVRSYFCGGFNGGTSEAFLAMAENIAAAVNKDAQKGIKAIWNDESFLNRYLYDNPPARILDPSFCYPESEYKHPGGYYSAIWRSAGLNNVTPKLLALDKGPR